MKVETRDPLNKASQNRLEKVDLLIANLTSNKNRDKINQIFQSIASSDGSCNTLGMWKQVKKLFPTILKSVPTGIRDHHGKIVTKISSVKQIITRKYKIRLRKRPANQDKHNDY